MQKQRGTFHCLMEILLNTDTTFLLLTTGEEKIVPTRMLTCLEVSGFGNHSYNQLPDVLTQRKCPVTINADGYFITLTFFLLFK